MSTELWRRANDLFEQALDVPEVERPSWLDHECANDPALRSEVERRLQTDAEAEADGFLAQSLMPTPASEHDAATETEPGAGQATVGEASGGKAAPPMPERLGPYRVTREIGRGGMGTVYAAERDDDAFHRQVAIKVITAGTENDEVARRMRAERRILALLEHPNIARIYDGGALDDGRPYFVMELVSGLQLDEYCAAHNLLIKQRITLMRQVCSAVDYAHRNLVVHRDLKPSNIMITEGGEAKLLDFGIAKVLETDPDSSVEATVPWRQHLSLHYASPEQLRGHAVSTASDVYALGVLLFRLLTGAMPRSFDGVSPWQAEKDITASEVPRPSDAVRAVGEPTARPPGDPRQLERQLAGDLDAIILKALRADPEDRYRSAGHLADDLDRFENGLPVDARRGSWRYRAAKLLRRNPLAVSLASVALALGLGFAVSKARSANRLAHSQARLVTEQATQEAILRFLLGMFEDAGPFVAEGVSLTLLDAVDKQAELVTEQFGGQPEVEADIQSALGWIYLDLGEIEKANRHHQRASALYRDLGDGSGIAESQDGIAAALREQWQLDRAGELSAEALELHRRSASNPRRLARSLNQRVKLFCMAEEWQAADALSSEALTVARGARDDNNREIAQALVQRAAVLSHLGQPEDARQLYLQTESLYNRLHGPDHPIFATLYNNLAGIEARANRPESAVGLWRRADAQYVKAYGEDFYNRVFPLTNLGRHLHHAGDLPGAEKALLAALDVATRSPDLGPQHELGYYGPPAIALAKIWVSNGRCPELRELLERRIATWARKKGHPIVEAGRALLAECDSGPKEQPP